MKINLSEDEWYPCYSISDWGLEIHVPAEKAAKWQDAMNAFADAQEDMATEYKRWSKPTLNGI